MATDEVVDRTALVSTEPDPMLGTDDDIKGMPHCEGERELDEREWAGAVITPSNDDGWIHVELYNSGAT